MMKHMTATAALLLAAGAIGAQQPTSSSRIRIHKDQPATASETTNMSSTTNTSPSAMPADTVMYGWYVPSPTTSCSSVDVNAARAVQIKSDLYKPGSMISPDSAKVVALCAVPGQIGSGEMNTANGRTEYAIDIIPNHKKTHTKVIVDAQTGAVLSSKQYGGLRGLTGWVRESAEHRTNAAKAKKDTMPF